jgi:hypothetical protein
MAARVIDDLGEMRLKFCEGQIRRNTVKKEKRQENSNQEASTTIYASLTTYWVVMVKHGVARSW